MNWCEEKVGTLTYINNAKDLLDFMQNYTVNHYCASPQKGIKLKIYYIEFFKNNPKDIKKMAEQVYRMVFDWEKLVDIPDLPEDFIIGERLPMNINIGTFIEPLIEYIVFEKLGNIPPMKSEVSGEVFPYDRSFPEFDLENYLYNNNEFLTFFTDFIGQIVYTKSKIKAVYGPLLDFVNQTLSNDMYQSGFFYRKILEFLHDDDFKEELKLAFLQTIKEQMITDMGQSAGREIFVLYAPGRITGELDNL